MRRSQASYLLTIVAALLVLLGLVGGWLLSAWAAQGQPTTRSWQLGLALLALLVVGSLFWLQRFMQIYFNRLRRLAEEARLILQSNPDRRVPVDGPADVRQLSALLNEFGGHFQRLLNERDEQVRQARADLEEERNLLATLMADLSDGVLVCNRDGRILLYNLRARQLLSASALEGGEAEAPSARGYVGLGRSIFGVLDRNAITYGLSHLQSRLSGQERERSGANFMTTTSNGVLVRAHMSPILGGAGDLHGFVLTLQDVTQGITASSRRDFLLQRLTERVRGGLGNIRAAIETLAQYPTMSPTQTQRFQGIIEEEAATLSGELDQTMREFAGDLHAQWRFAQMSGDDLLRAVQHYLEAHEGVQIASALVDEGLWLRVDSYAIVHGLATAVRSLHHEFAIQTIALHLHHLPPSLPHNEERKQRFVTLDVRWPSRTITVEAWLAWKERVTRVDDSDATLTLREVADRHGSEIWFQHDPATDHSYFRLLLPRATGEPKPSPALSTAAAGALLGSRPEYYDFDLFQSTASNTTLGQRPLGTLSYTVFDTETTGLDPARDEIVSIGAVRILNGRLLRQELFDQLVDPGRPIPHVATSVHGISTAMVQGQPSIFQVLPRFFRFGEETVLVGHNVAFDLRLFQVKEEYTGVHFAQPILDTLLLSEVIQPDEENHELEAIAARLGVNVLGRHTALGDALVTAEVFLRMLPLLQSKGILTLDAALAASQRTLMARVRY